MKDGTPYWSPRGDTEQRESSVRTRIAQGHKGLNLPPLENKSKLHRLNSFLDSIAVLTSRSSAVLACPQRVLKVALHRTKGGTDEFADRGASRVSVECCSVPDIRGVLCGIVQQSTTSGKREFVVNIHKQEWRRDSRLAR